MTKHLNSKQNDKASHQAGNGYKDVYCLSFAQKHTTSPKTSLLTNIYFFLGQNLWMKNVISSTHIEGSSKIILLSIIIWEDQRKAHHIQVQKLNMLSCVKIIPIPKKVWTPPTTPYHWQHTKSFHNILFNNEIFHLRKKLTNLEKKFANMMEKIESLELLWAIRCNMVEINFHRYYKQHSGLNKIGGWCHLNKMMSQVY